MQGALRGMPASQPAVGASYWGWIAWVVMRRVGAGYDACGVGISYLHRVGCGKWVVRKR
jgi:hypothetical protein